MATRPQASIQEKPRIMAAGTVSNRCVINRSTHTPHSLYRYVRERGVLSLEEAVRKVTSLAADHVGIEERGRLVPGAYADLVLFDSATVIDRATTSDPHALATGIERFG